MLAHATAGALGFLVAQPVKLETPVVTFTWCLTVLETSFFAFSISPQAAQVMPDKFLPNHSCPPIDH